MKRLMALMALTTLTACDYAQRQEFRAERADAVYRKAMADYGAGRIDAAVKGFEEAVRSDPGNASARFQLGCLLMDGKSDPLGAVCCFREYILQEPKSDKAEIAARRLALCEKSLAEDLARRYRLTDGAEAAQETAALAKARAESDRHRGELEEEIAGLKKRLAATERENARLRRMISAVGEEETDSSARSNVAEARRLLDEEDDEDRLRLSPDAKALFDDAEEEENRSPLIAGQTRGVPGEKLTETGAGRTQPADSAPPHEPRPQVYVVEDGDTLTRIALRFYGRKSAWKQIREANKATVSTDGRIKAGDRLTLP